MKLNHLQEARYHKDPHRDPFEEAYQDILQALEASGANFDEQDEQSFSYDGTVKNLQKIVRAFNKKFGKPEENHPLLIQITWNTGIPGSSVTDTIKIYVDKADSMDRGGTWHNISVF